MESKTQEAELSTFQFWGKEDTIGCKTEFADENFLQSCVLLQQIWVTAFKSISKALNLSNELQFLTDPILVHIHLQYFCYHWLVALVSNSINEL